MKKSERAKMTKTQFHVLKLINGGNSSKMIALYLGCTVQTVGVHRKNLYKRIGVHSVWQVSDYCAKHKIKGNTP